MRWDQLIIVADKDQEVDLEHSSETHLDEADGDTSGKVMSTIRGVGNKSLTHTNSLNTISSSGSRVPKYGVVTSHEEELGQCLENIKVWGIDVFQITDLSNLRPLTAVTFQVFQDRDLLSFFKIPATNLVSLLLTLEDHYLKVKQ